MRGAFLSVVCLVGLSMVASLPYPQQPVALPPHLLRQYLAQQQQERPRQQEPTPIYEQESQANAQPQYTQREQPTQQYVQQYVPQPQPQPQYVAQPQPQYSPKAQRPRPRPAAQQVPQALQEEDPADYDPNPSYQFGFDVNDDQFTNYQNRQEERQGNVIKGSYSVVDSDGFIRTVTYTADPKEGFKAEVVRKPTDIVVKVPTPAPQTEVAQRHQPQQYLESSQRHTQSPQYLEAASRPASRPQQQPQQYYRYQ